MFKHYERKVPTHLKKPIADLTRIMQASALFSDEKRSGLLEQIKEASALDTERYDRLALSLLNNVATYCQSLPESSTAYYSYAGGLLDHLLNRTEASLSLFKYFLLDDTEELSEEQKLWQYALLSAGLLQGIGKLLTDFDVELYDGQGAFLKDWNPLLDSAMTPGSYYNAEIIKEVDSLFRTRLASVLSRTLMPLGGFAWIASNPEVLRVWLALLNDDFQDAGVLGALLIRANGISIQRYLNQLLLKFNAMRGNRLGWGNSFIPNPNDPVKPEQQIGLAFLQWVTQALDNGSIIINKPPLLAVPGGLVMSADIFKLFIREHPEYKNWQAVHYAFLGLGLGRSVASPQKGPGDIVLNNYAAVLPSFVNFHSAETRKDQKVTATEAVQAISRGADVQALSVLNAVGKWQDAPSASLEQTQQFRPLSGV